MTQTTKPVITADMAGCWFAGASNRTADELNVAVIDAALTYGWAPEDRVTLETLSPDGWFDDPDLAEMASDAALDAESYLQAIAPEGYAFGFDDGFYLLPACAWEWYERTSHDPCPHADCPNA